MTHATILPGQQSRQLAFWNAGVRCVLLLCYAVVATLYLVTAAQRLNSGTPGDTVIARHSLTIQANCGNVAFAYTTADLSADCWGLSASCCKFTRLSPGWRTKVLLTEQFIQEGVELWPMFGI